MSRFKEILIPVDFSDHSLAALEAAVDLAKVFDSRLHLIHCYSIQPGGISPYGVAMPSSYFTDIREAASKQLAEWRLKHLPADILVDTKTVSQMPSKAIVEAALEVGADLIVMGTRGHSGFKHALLGSVTERTIRIAPCPVLTVHAPKADRADGDD
jgi:nucleotide-binding universal stress UspA family protein